MRTARAALLIAATDLRRRLRSRSLLLQAFVGPLLLATIISLAFGGGFSFDAEVHVVDGDRSETSQAIQERLVAASDDGLTFIAGDRDDPFQAPAVVIPPGLQESLSATSPIAIEVVTDADDAIGSAVARSVARAVGARLDAARLAMDAAARAGLPPPDRAVLQAIELPVSVSRGSAGDEVSPAAHFGPGMGLLFLFLSVGSVARGLLEERRLHLLDRMRAAPVPVSAILAGRCASVVVVGALSLLVIWAATAALLGADWGDPVGVVALIGASALAVAGVAGAVAVVARTEPGAETFATVVGFVLGLVGGNMLPLSDLPESLRRFSLLTPNGWSIQGFAELSAGGGSLVDVLPHVAVLLGWAIVLGAVAAALLPKRLGMR